MHIMPFSNTTFRKHGTEHTKYIVKLVPQRTGVILSSWPQSTEKIWLNLRPEKHGRPIPGGDAHKYMFSNLVERIILIKIGQYRQGQENGYPGAYYHDLNIFILILLCSPRFNKIGNITKNNEKDDH